MGKGLQWAGVRYGWQPEWRLQQGGGREVLRAQAGCRGRGAGGREGGGRGAAALPPLWEHLQASLSLGLLPLSGSGAGLG